MVTRASREIQAKLLVRIGAAKSSTRKQLAWTAVALPLTIFRFHRTGQRVCHV